MGNVKMALFLKRYRVESLIIPIMNLILVILMQTSKKAYKDRMPKIIEATNINGLL